MNVEALKSRTKEMIANDADFINKLVDKAIDSGCMDIEGAEDNYKLPKNLLSAIYKEMSRQYSPLDSDKAGKKETSNIYNHL